VWWVADQRLPTDTRPKAKAKARKQKHESYPPHLAPAAPATALCKPHAPSLYMLLALQHTHIKRAAETGRVGAHPWAAGRAAHRCCA